MGSGRGRADGSENSRDDRSSFAAGDNACREDPPIVLMLRDEPRNSGVQWSCTKLPVAERSFGDMHA
jgi:hypothetical protein